jgi:hypothetical protein
LPQLPQSAAFDCVSTQVPAHWVSPVWHWQLPLTQLVPIEHCVPQAPQLASSLLGSAHPVAHCTCPVAHTGPDPPAAPNPPMAPSPPMPSVRDGVPELEQAATTAIASIESRRREIRIQDEEDWVMTAFVLAVVVGRLWSAHPTPLTQHRTGG